MRTLPLLILTITLTLASSIRADEPKPAAPLPDGYKLVYSNDFDSPESLKGLQATDIDAWKFTKEGKSGGAIEQFKKSDYKYKVRSPFNIALIDGHTFGDFVLEVDLQQTGKEYGHRDMCLFFNLVDRNHFYYIHMSTKSDPHAHNVFIVNDKPRTKISHKTSDGIRWGEGNWRHVRIERDTKAGTIKLFWEDMSEPIMEAKDDTFKRGFIGFGSFDDTGKVDNVRIWAPPGSMKKTDQKDIFKEGQPKE